jgi:hypothetical protein
VTKTLEIEGDKLREVVRELLAVIEMKAGFVG